jgi:16S rRNA (uracil1498-N3)-methyltransferase
LVAALTPATSEISDALSKAPGARRVALVIGPEGDMEDAELETFTSAGFLPVTLGPTVLRAETAATAGIAVISALLRARWTT